MDLGRPSHGRFYCFGACIVMSNTLPTRVTTNELAAIWKVTTTRIYQFEKSGRIVRGEDGKFDRDECLAFRAKQLSDSEAQVLFKPSANQHGLYPPKIVDHLIAAPAPDPFDDPLYDPDDFDPLADDPPSGPTAAPVQARDVMAEAVKSTSRLSEVRAQEAEARLRRLNTQHAREEGLLIERARVHRACQEAGGAIVNMLQTLEHEIPAIFADADVRSQVRDKVQQAVDRCRFTIFKKMNELADVEVVDDDDDDQS